MIIRDIIRSNQHKQTERLEKLNDELHLKAELSSTITENHLKVSSYFSTTKNSWGFSHRATADAVHLLSDLPGDFWL